MSHVLMGKVLYPRPEQLGLKQLIVCFQRCCMLVTSLYHCDKKKKIPEENNIEVESDWELDFRGFIPWSVGPEGNPNP